MIDSWLILTGRISNQVGSIGILFNLTDISGCGNSTVWNDGRRVRSISLTVLNNVKRLSSTKQILQIQISTKQILQNLTNLSKMNFCLSFSISYVCMYNNSEVCLISKKRWCIQLMDLPSSLAQNLGNGDITRKWCTSGYWCYGTIRKHVRNKKFHNTNIPKCTIYELCRLQESKKKFPGEFFQ